MESAYSWPFVSQWQRAYARLVNTRCAAASLWYVRYFWLRCSTLHYSRTRAENRVVGRPSTSQHLQSHNGEPNAQSSILASPMPLTSPSSDWRYDSFPNSEGRPRSFASVRDVASILNHPRARMEERTHEAARGSKHEADTTSSASGHPRPSNSDDSAWGTNVHLGQDSSAGSPPASSSAEMSVAAQTDVILSTNLAVGSLEPRLAKYPCTYCGKRFNRPSSLKVSLPVPRPLYVLASIERSPKYYFRSI